MRSCFNAMLILSFLEIFVCFCELFLKLFTSGNPRYRGIILYSCNLALNIIYSLCFFGNTVFIIVQILFCV